MSENIEPNLTPKEQGIVQDLLGPSREQLFSGIAEVWLGQNSKVEDWGEQPLVSPGIVCFIKDLDKDNLQLWVINMSKGIVAWKQNVDKHITTRRRRRWLFVLDVGYRKLCLNFVDDDEADEFAYALYAKFPEFQNFEGTTPYTVKEDGRVFRNPGKKGSKSKQEKRRNFVVNVAGLSESVLEDPAYCEKIDEFFEEYGDEIEEYGDIFNNYDLEIETESEEEIIGGEDDGGSTTDNPLSSEVASPSLDFSSCFDMGEYSAVDMEEVTLESVPEDRALESNQPKPNTNIPPPPPPLNIPKPPPPPLNIPKPLKPNAKNTGGEGERRGSLLDQIRSGTSLRKSSINTTQKRTTQRTHVADSIENVLLGAMQQIRTMKDTDYGALDEATYRDWDASD